MTHSGEGHSKEPIRLFRSDILEFFTHTHPVMVVIVFAPTAAYFLWQAIARRPAPWAWGYALLAFAVGLFLWTLIEYLLHRFIFHFKPQNPRQERLQFLIHGIHHAQPLSKTRLVMPPAFSVPLAALFYGLFQLFAGAILGLPQAVPPLFGAFLVGYLFYDLSHYTIHHANVRLGYWRFLRRHHMRHHTTPSLRFGVTSPLWDHVLGTWPRDQAPVQQSR